MQLSPLSESGAPPVFLPPHWFRPIRGTPLHVALHSVEYVCQKGTSAAQKAGLRYENKFQKEMIERFPKTYLPGAHISFSDLGGRRTVVPDGLLIAPTRTFLFEIKISHRAEAWWQLEKLYKPLVLSMGFAPVTCVEVVRSFDVALPFPCPFELLTSFDTSSSHSDFEVLLWR